MKMKRQNKYIYIYKRKIATGYLVYYYHYASIIGTVMLITQDGFTKIILFLSSNHAIIVTFFTLIKMDYI